MSEKKCAVPDCYMSGQHLAACADKTCPGCVPALAVSGLLICSPHHAMGVRALRALAKVQSDLMDGLGGSYRSPQAPKGAGGRSNERPDVIPTSSYGDSPEQPGILEQRQLIHEWLADTLSELIAAGVVSSPGRGWDVPLMVRIILRHVDWLSADPVHAPKWALRFDRLARDGRRLANRSRVSGLYLGECPMTVAKNGEQAQCGGPIRYQREPGLAASDRATTIACPWCKYEETAWWWCQRINPTSRRILMGNAAGVASLLSQKYLGQLALMEKVVNESTIRGWASDGWIDAAGCHLKSRRNLYFVADCEAQAIRAFGLTNPDMEDAS